MVPIKTAIEARPSEIPKLRGAAACCGASTKMTPKVAIAMTTKGNVSVPMASETAAQVPATMAHPGRRQLNSVPETMNRVSRICTL